MIELRCSRRWDNLVRPLVLLAVFGVSGAAFADGPVTAPVPGNAQVLGAVTRGGVAAGEVAVTFGPHGSQVPRQRTATTDDGLFKVEDLAPGEWDFELAGQLYPLSLHPSQTGRLSVQLPGLPRDVQEITVPATAFLEVAQRITIDQVGTVCGPMNDALDADLKTTGVTATGPVVYRYLNWDGNPKNAFDFQLAYPVPAAIAWRGPGTFVSISEFHCLTYTWHGAMTGIPSAWGKLVNASLASGYQPSAEGREIYTQFIDHDSAQDITVVQMGIK